MSYLTSLTRENVLALRRLCEQIQRSMRWKREKLVMCARRWQRCFTLRAVIKSMLMGKLRSRASLLDIALNAFQASILTTTPETLAALKEHGLRSLAHH